MFEMTRNSNVTMNQMTTRFDTMIQSALKPTDANDPGATAETAGTIGNGA